VNKNKNIVKSFIPAL